MVGGHMPPDRPDHLVIAVAAGHEPALAPDQLHLGPPVLAACLSVMPGCWRDLGALAPGADPDLRGAGRRARWPAAGDRAAGAPGPAAVRLPGGQPPSARAARRAGRGAVARTRPCRGRRPAQPAAVQAAPGV